MKKIIRLLIPIILAFVLSSYIYPPTTVKKSLKSNDSINTELVINVNARSVNAGPYKLETNEKFTEALESTIKLNELKTTILEKLETEPKINVENIPTTQEIILHKHGYSNKFIVKRIRNDTIIKFCIILIMIIFTIFWVVKIYNNRRDEWKILLIRGFFIITSIFICQIFLHYIITYLFNKDFLIMKELIKLLT